MWMRCRWQPRGGVAARPRFEQQVRAAHGGDPLVQQPLGAIPVPLPASIADLQVRGLIRHGVVPDHRRKAHVDRGIRGDELRQLRREPERGERHRRVHRDLAALGSAEQAERGIGELLEGLAHGRQIGDPHRRELHAARQPLEQREAEMRLERADLVADCSRGEPELRRGGGEARGAGGRLEGPQPRQGGQSYHRPGRRPAETAYVCLAQYRPPFKKLWPKVAKNSLVRAIGAIYCGLCPPDNFQRPLK